MIYYNFENYLRIFNFSGLFLTLFFCWIKAFFFPKLTNNKIEIFVLLVCNWSLTCFLLVRWIQSNHFPISNLYESLIFLCWSLITFLIFLQKKNKEIILGFLITPLIFFITTFATFSLPVEMQKASFLIPALQSNWLMMHVTIMILSYAALIFGSLLGIVFLIIFYLVNFFKKDKKIFAINILQYTNNKTQKIFLNKIDTLSYRIIGIGFPLLTIGILSGAIWANETWGSYWSWDPKETWALITWFIYAIYLHSRIINRWDKEKAALIASFGFLAVWFCYLGVNLFAKGLHSYGWFI